jgi:hypothetical protein
MKIARFMAIVLSLTVGVLVIEYFLNAVLG